jgi:fatty acid desaturase
MAIADWQSRPFIVPAELHRKRSPLFCVRIALAATIMSLASAGMMSGSFFLFSIGLIVQGAMYVHLIELQHALLHHQVFNSAALSRAIGFVLGIPMLISYSDFQYNHLQHHRHLGTKLNTETFSYRHEKLDSISGFLRGMFDYSRLPAVVTKLIGRHTDKKIEQEYRVFCVLLLATVIVDWKILIVWLAPLVVAEPIHFLLELPEHFGLPAHTNNNVFENTRAWGGSWFTRWYTHYTNYHTAHHYIQTMPMDNLPELQKLLDAHIPESSRSKSYPHFFLQVIKGEIKNTETAGA